MDIMRISVRIIMNCKRILKGFLNENLQITAYMQHFIRQQVMPGDICIDATMGNGNDTALLSQLAGKRGRVLAFDIQKQALEHTKERLKRDNCPENYQLLLESHENMDVYAEEETVSCITFNLGYLPGGDHSVATRADSSIRAVESGLKLLKKGGLMTLCIYSGGDTGYQERDEMLAFIRQLDPHKYLVILSEYANRPNDPPIPVLIIKLQ